MNMDSSSPCQSGRSACTSAALKGYGSRFGRVRGLLGTLLAILLPLNTLVAVAETEERTLIIQDGDARRHYPVTQLVAELGIQRLAVPQDPNYGTAHAYSGFGLRRLLDHVGLGDAKDLLLVCADGYSIPFAAQEILAKDVQGLLAIRDLAMPEGGSTHWQRFRHGAEVIDFDPFYLVWAARDEAGAQAPSLGPDSIPWPFQLTEIRRFDPDDYFAAARPSPPADSQVQAGFELYKAHCGKCHRMRGVGGSVGPELDRAFGLASLMTPEQLTGLVEHSPERYPQSKMPVFGQILRPAEITKVVAYLEAMQRPPPGP